MAKRPPEDLFDSSTMTFGEHLEELRTVLVRGLIGLMIGFVIGLFIANRIVQVIQGPLKNALDAYYLDKAKSELIADYQGGAAPPEELELIKQRGLVQDHINLDPVGVLQCLRLAAPERFGELELPQFRFLPADLRAEQVGALCQRLEEDGTEDKSTPAGELWRQMSVQQRSQVESLAGRAEVDADQQQELLDILNSLVDHPDLFASEPFRAVEARPDVVVSVFKPWTWAHDSEISDARQATLDRLREDLEETPDVDKARRLNKLLIAEALHEFMFRPQKLLVEVPVWKPTDIRVQSLGAHEAFMIWLKAGFVSGLILSSPWIFWQLWLFVGAGLYPHEKRYVHVFLPISLALFLSGVALAFLFVFEPVLSFLFSFNKVMEIDPDPRISEWIGFVLFLPLGFGVAFQLPLAMLFINRIGLISIGVYLEKWRIAVLVIFVISMLLTPADPISMLLMAIPLTLLYFFGIGLCKWMPKFKNPYSEVYEPA